MIVTRAAAVTRKKNSTQCCTRDVLVSEVKETQTVRKPRRNNTADKGDTNAQLQSKSKREQKNNSHTRQPKIATNSDAVDVILNPKSKAVTERANKPKPYMELTKPLSIIGSDNNNNLANSKAFDSTNFINPKPP
ncbi:MAG: hypothetical protein MHPSP_002772, partial [Paramarteilia canceri]